MLLFLWATSSFQKSPNLVTLLSNYARRFGESVGNYIIVATEFNYKVK
jgi:hypothetical protein